MATSERQITTHPHEKLATSSVTPSQSKTGSVKKSSNTDLEENTQQGTVLLRHPLPKYSFQVSKKNRIGKKEPKKTEVVTANVLPNVRSEKQEVISLALPQKPVSKVDPIQNSYLTTTHGASVSSSDNNVNIGDSSHVTATTIRAVASLGDVPMHYNASGSASHFESLPFPELSSNRNTCHEEELKLLKEEVNSLKNQLDVQVKVNGELKKLLIASVGDDLHSRVERLARDRAQMALELGDFTKKMVEDYENLDKVAIQADMWRSKYLASRVMSDELASAKAFFAMQLQESQHAIQQLLNERHELRTNLMETCRCLQQVKSAFDPLNTQKSSVLSSSNAVDLAKRNKELSESIRYRLLPSTVPLQTNIDMDVYMEDTYTKAESYAHELLSKKVDFENIPQVAPGSSVIDRYHPYTNFDNLTFNCCNHCKGELSAL